MPTLLQPLTTEPALSPQDDPEEADCRGLHKDHRAHEWRFVRSASFGDASASLFVCDRCGKECVE